jgi:hypothetical protein
MCKNLYNMKDLTDEELDLFECPERVANIIMDPLCYLI